MYSTSGPHRAVSGLICHRGHRQGHLHYFLDGWGQTVIDAPSSAPLLSYPCEREGCPGLVLIRAGDLLR